VSTKFFTNQGAQTLFAKLGAVTEHNPDLERFDALVGYLRASGYFALRPYLDRIPQIRILVGINVDALMADYHRRGMLFLTDPNKTIEEFSRVLRQDIQTATYTREVEDGIVKLVEDVVSKKVTIKAHPTKRLHAKIYIFLPKGFNEHRPGSVITGSSNLTAAGLGTEENSRNYEFNVLLHDYADVRFAAEEFERLWAESVEVLPAEIKAIRDSTYLGQQVTPYQLYYKLLLEYFGSSIDYDPNALSDLPTGYKRLSYQVDAVSSGYRLLERHNGFFLADVVGLGKTIIATLIAKKFFFKNGFPEHRSHTLIVVPPALEEGWHTTLEQFRLDNYRIITNGSLHKLNHPEKYDLVIVDEAHKFRNDTAEAFDELQRICKSPTLRTLPGGVKATKKVILVSATPLNNRPEDIRNLIALFQDLKDSTLSIANLQHYFARKEKEYREARGEADVEVARQRVKSLYEDVRDKVVSEITVRRTRTDLITHEQYKKDLDEQAVVFPKVEKPRHILYPLPPTLEAVYDRTVKLLSAKGDGGLTYNRYRAISFLRAEKKAKYQSADRISQQLATIMRVLLIKRLDSSFYAFKQSLNRFRDATNVMAQMFRSGTIYIAPNLSVTEYLMEGREDELIAKIAERQPTDPTIEICTPDDFEPGLVEGVEGDLAKLQDLCAAWEKITEDPKLDEFLIRLKSELFDRNINHEGNKLVVFSESKETTSYLQARLTEAGYKRILIVDSATRKDRMGAVRANFDANTKEQANDFDILLTTEVLAEGVNLHRANIIVNYDTPWNSTRLMQRVGRVNRIGTTAPRIYIYNFYPTARVDDDIELRKKAIMKLQAFHTALGEDSQIYSVDEEVDTFGLFERSPEEDQRDERLGLLMELRKFRENHPEEFKRVQNLPLRGRAGRLDAARKGSTVTFIRTRQRDGFYRLGRSAEPEELTIIEAAREFRATDPKEKTIPLHAAHHDHVNAALQTCEEQAISEKLQSHTVEAAQGPNERRALAYLDGFLNLAFISDREKELILAAKLAIKRARFQKLQRQINQLQISTKEVKLTTVALLAKLVAILNTYPLVEANAPRDAASLLTPLEAAADIILSESFDGAAP
jgi:superfamily II DNA or RNA helicase